MAKINTYLFIFAFMIQICLCAVYVAMPDNVKASLPAGNNPSNMLSALSFSISDPVALLASFGTIISFFFGAGFLLIAGMPIWIAMPLAVFFILIDILVIIDIIIVVRGIIGFT